MVRTKTKTKLAFVLVYVRLTALRAYKSEFFMGSVLFRLAKIAIWTKLTPHFCSRVVREQNWNCSLLSALSLQWGQLTHFYHQSHHIQGEQSMRHDVVGRVTMMMMVIAHTLQCKASLIINYRNCMLIYDYLYGCDLLLMAVVRRRCRQSDNIDNASHCEMMTTVAIHGAPVGINQPFRHQPTLLFDCWHLVSVLDFALLLCCFYYHYCRHGRRRHDSICCAKNAVTVCLSHQIQIYARRSH